MRTQSKNHLYFPAAAVAALLLVTACTDFAGGGAESETSVGTTDESPGSTGAPSSSGGGTGGTGGSADATGQPPLPTDATSTTSSPPAETGAVDSSSTGGPAVCGDGQVQGDEACDDGNDDDTDACSNLCEAATCRDGVRNGSEADIDCGGDCSPCGTGAGCGGPEDCEHGVCVEGTCAAPSCRDGVANQGEITADCGPVCRTPPSNVLVNSGFDEDTAGWDVENPEVGNQGTYFSGNSSNRVVELDRSPDNTSSWRQDFDVPDFQVGVPLEVRVRVSDRQGQSGDVGGLLVSVFGPGGAPLPLNASGDADFVGSGGTQVGVDALSTSDFRQVIFAFQAVEAGVHTVELLEQTDGGEDLDDGAGIILDDAEVWLVDCGG